MGDGGVPASTRYVPATQARLRCRRPDAPRFLGVSFRSAPGVTRGWMVRGGSRSSSDQSVGVAVPSLPHAGSSGRVGVVSGPRRESLWSFRVRGVRPGDPSHASAKKVARSFPAARAQAASLSSSRHGSGGLASASPVHECGGLRFVPSSIRHRQVTSTVGSVTVRSSARAARSEVVANPGSLRTQRAITRAVLGTERRPCGTGALSPRLTGISPACRRRSPHRVCRPMGWCTVHRVRL
jgi:hypothetical protein